VYGDEDQCQNTQLALNALKMKNRFKEFGVCVPNNPYVKVITSEKDFKNLLKISTGITDEERLLEDKALLKWVFGQGGTFVLSQLTANLDEYFAPRSCADIDDEDVATASYLSDICCILPQENMIITNSIYLYRTFRGDHRSYAGATYDGDRRTPGVASMAVRIAILTPYDIDYTIAGMRLKDNKYRNIFMDSFANYFREAMFLHKMFQLWHSLPFDSNQGDLRCAAKILKFQAKESYGGDYKSMDMHHSYDASVKLMRLLQVWFKMSTRDVFRIIFWLKDLHQQAILVGDKLYVPTNTVNLLSGLYPTHDFEGPENTLILAKACRYFRLKIVARPRKLKKDEVAIIVCGDDSIVLFGDAMPENFPQIHADIAMQWGQIVETEKVEHSTTVAWFCKKAYPLRDDVPGFVQTQIDGQDTRIPKYSIRKALNSLYHPENYPKFKEPRDILIWFCMILDNVAGNKQYKQTLKILVDKNPSLFSYENVADLVKDQPLSSEMEDYIRSDWWMNYVYDPQWLTKSFTAKSLAKMFHLI
jgi:hypothetical protein